jgi:hypothetical protein
MSLLLLNCYACIWNSLHLWHLNVISLPHLKPLVCALSSLQKYHVCCKCADSRPKLVAGSAEGYSGHVDGKLREARMNHPKGITVDDRGNIYVADIINMAIRKISDSG